ncbi:hypothetical protein AAJV73_11175 [Cyanobium sp. BSA11S]|uniref:hypothetical protein n=1 Tax=Cyanobium sp. BSA11S TaxID=3108224 RepID=UPI003D8158A8
MKAPGRLRFEVGEPSDEDPSGNLASQPHTSATLLGATPSRSATNPRKASLAPRADVALSGASSGR